ncbi:MAG: hypothetical protein LBV09_06355 [Deferribacteraceae bacterium]|jgi:hypothetical protein|nr:hypothetical protein [Deferribacteraceae bacterium]
MSVGITTILSQSAIPEKIADVTDRAADNKQQATVVVAQHQSEERTNVVQAMDKLDTTGLIRRKDERDEEQKKRKKKENKQDARKGHLDLKA